MQKILLITGGLGYIGSHAVVAFEYAGYKTVIIDNLSNSSQDVLSGIKKILGYTPEFYEGDIRDKPFLERLFEKYSFDGVIHFAWLKAVGESCKNIALYHENNIYGSMILFEIMQKFSVKKIVFSSSATVYRSDNISPLTEDMALGSSNPYGTTKLVIEKLLEDYASHAYWSVMNLRYFNPIGAHPSGYIWELHQGIPNNLLPYILDVAFGLREKVYIYGNDYDTIDGTGVRDYIDVNDLINAHIKSYEKLTSWFFSYNIWTGNGVSVLEMIEAVEKVSHKSIPYEIISRRVGDLPCVIAWSDKVIEELSWFPERSLWESIESSWKFIITKNA